MKFQKKVLHSLERCYSIAPLTLHQEKCFLVASEKRNACLLFDQSGTPLQTVWQEPGGTMSMEQIPGTDGCFIATSKFYSPDDSAGGELIYIEPQAHSWRIRSVAALPFVHRFGILRGGERLYLVAATLKSAHAYAGDLSSPGKVYAAELPEPRKLSENCRLSLRPILENLHKNHGFCKNSDNSCQQALIGAQEGIFKITPPQNDCANWSIEQLLDLPTSDMAMIDLDGDGDQELVVFSPFHGDQLRVMKKNGSEWRCVFEQKGLGFLHAIWSGDFHGIPMVLVGHRSGDQALYSLTFDKEYQLTLIDSGVGPANVSVFPVCGVDSVLSANCETNEIAVYIPDLS